MRWSRTLAPVVVLVLVAACGSSAASADGNGNGGGNGTEESEAAATATPTAAATPDDGGGGGGSGGGSGGGVASGDLEALVDDLTPPNSTEVNRTTAEGIIFVIWESTDSTDSLRSFYEGAIDDTGMEVFSTTQASGAYSWLFAESEGSSFGGAVTVAPSSSGGSGSTVSVQVSTGD